MSQQCVLVTGANGFISRALCAEAVARSMPERGITRTTCDLITGIESVVVSGINDGTD